MLNDEELAILSDIGESIAFDDNVHGLVDKLIIGGYVVKDGDIFELTYKGEGVLIDHGAGGAGTNDR